MGTSISFLSATSPENGENYPAATHRTKEQRIRDAESEARVKLDKIRRRIRELERKKHVLVLIMERIQDRLGERITGINNEHDKHEFESRTVQTSIQLDNSEIATKVAETLGTEGIVPEEPQEMVQCDISELNAIQSVALVTEDQVGTKPETNPVTDTSDLEPFTAVQSETLVTEDRLGQTQQLETYSVTDASAPDTATTTNAPFMTEQEESLLNQLLRKKLNYIHISENGLDGVPIMKPFHVYLTPLEKAILHDLGTMFLYDLWHGKGLKLKELYIRHIKSKTLPPVTQDTDDTLQGDTANAQEDVPRANKSSTNQQLLEPRGQETTQLTNESTHNQQQTNDSMCLSNSSPQVLSTEGVTYCLSDMLASCSQPVTKTFGQKTIQEINKSPTSHHLSKRLEERSVQRAKKSTIRKNITKSKNKLSTLYVKFGKTAQDEWQKKLLTFSYDSSFWRQIQCQPVVGENAGKENDTTQNQPHAIASWRNASIGENKNTTPVPRVAVKVVSNNNLRRAVNKEVSANIQATTPTRQQSKSVRPTEKVPASANLIKLDTYNTNVLYQNKTQQASVAGPTADEALKIAVEAIRSCPRVISSVYRLEHLTRTLESQIVYLETLSSFNMYLKAPLIMREVCAKLGPYFLWDWCRYANKIRAREKNGIHREMLNFLKNKVYCSSLYLRPYYEEHASDN